MATAFLTCTLILIAALLYLAVYCWHVILLNRSALNQCEGWEAMYRAVCHERDELKEALSEREQELDDANESIEFLDAKIRGLKGDGEWWRDGGDPPWAVG